MDFEFFCVHNHKMQVLDILLQSIEKEHIGIKRSRKVLEYIVSTKCPRERAQRRA